MKINSYETLDEMYIDAINEIIHYGIVTSPRDMKTYEVIGYSATLKDLGSNIITIDCVKTNLDYAKAEFTWYLSGSDRVADMGKYAKIWAKYSDDGKTVNSAYGQYMFKPITFNSGMPEQHVTNQWSWCVDKLTKDPDSRQAIININQLYHKSLVNGKPTKDFPCTIALQFLIRNNELHQVCYMRSNDIYLGFRNDVYCFTELQKRMAYQLGLAWGTYTHNTGSLHCYEENIPQMMEALTFNDL